jgi:toxin ParE1/3/4
MRYLVRLSERALRDMEAIYAFIHADISAKAFVWFNKLTNAVYSLEQFPERGAATTENQNLRHLLFGKKPDTYRIIYAIDENNHAVNVLHIRHGARARHRASTARRRD